jgi:hypothetical protein
MSKYGLQEQTSGLGRSVKHGQRIQPQPPDELEEDERYYVTRPHTSARRYTNAPTHITQGNTRYNVKYGAPPIPRRSSQATTEDDQYTPQTRKRIHWLTWVGVALFIMIIGWVALTAVSQWWQGVVDNFTYGTPRTYQIDKNVGHNNRESHFIAINLNGEVEVIETQKGHPEAAKIYTIVTMPEDQALIPVTLTFQDIRKRGRVDIIVHFGQTEIPMYNNGTGFQSQPPK